MPDSIERLTQALRDHYAVERELGQGGMAQRAVGRSVGRAVGYPHG